MNRPDPLASATDCLNLDQVAELRALSAPGEPDFFADLAQLYLANASDLLNKLQAALAEGDTAAVRAHAHTLKGMAGNLGAFVLQEQARLLEDKAKQSSCPPNPPELAAAFEAHRRLAEVLKAFLDSQ